MSFFSKYWPELFELGVIHRMQTPLYVTEIKGEIFEFFTVEEYEAWAKTAPKHKADYFKGLGGFETEAFERFLNNPDKYLVKINSLNESDLERINLAFSEKRADDRKDWLQHIRYFESLDA